MRAGEQALEQLLAGNRRFAAGCPEHPRQTPEARLAVADGQRPAAVVLTCMDSRVPPEILFDRGLGELFVLRLAGNVADEAVIASVEYATEHFGVPLVMVLGHSRCGAVTAAVQAGEAPGHLPALLAVLRPAVEQTRDLPGDHVDNAARLHVQRVVERLRACEPILSRLVGEGKVRILGAFYDVRTGVVTLL